MTADFEPAALGRYLDARFGAAPLALERISGGQSNPTYFATHGPRRMVLRKKPRGPVLPGAHAVEREFRVLSALHPVGVPVPRPILLEPDDAVLGTPFYLMERVEGRVFADAALPGAAPQERRALYTGLAQALAQLHAVRPDAVGLADFGRPGSYFERQIARWTKQWRGSGSAPIPELDRLADWLPAHLPPEDGALAVAHGDFRIGNVMFHPDEPRVVAILDWELATLGHPLADLAFCAMPWMSAPAEYGGILGRDLAALQLPGQAEFVAAYRGAAPGTGPLLPFHQAFALFRFAVIFVGIADRVRTGSAAAADAAALEPLARAFAARALQAARGDFAV